MRKLEREILLIRAYNNARAVTREMYELIEFPQLYAMKRRRMLKQMKDVVIDLNELLGKKELKEEDFTKGLKYR